MSKKKLSALFSGSSFLRITLFAGIIFLVLACSAFTLFFLIERSSTKDDRRMESLARLLREYDTLAQEAAGTEKGYQRLEKELDRIEKKTISVESWLSVLKRRRNLARLYQPSIENYRKSLDRAQELFPASQHIASLACEILIKNTAINDETEQNLRKLLPVFTSNSFNFFRLSLHVLLGDFNSPQRAAALPVELLSNGNESIFIDLAILKIIRNDIRGAASDIQNILQSESLSDASLRLAAEFHYDFGDMNRSAELFSLINDEKAVIRQADALYLAGFVESARAIWIILSNSDKPTERSLYNLGVTSQENDEAIFWYKKLINLQLTDNTDSFQYGLIHYSRLLDTTQAIALLGSNENLKPNVFPFIDLEICRRQAKNWELGRQMAEAWLLLDRHDNIEDLYLWAAWLFLFQRNYNEIEILLNRVETLDFSGQWIKVYRAIELMFDGDLETAQTLLRSIPPEYMYWSVHANLGCILEVQRSSARALEQYQIALEKAPNDKTASKIQTRIARCYTSLGLLTESLLALQDALELDPENLTAKLELSRITFSY